MGSAKNIGKRGEAEAESYFIDQGFETLAQNYRFGRAEVDLIVQKSDLLVFVEVKTRSSPHYGYPEESISHGQMERIHQVSESFMASLEWEGRVRFDVIAVMYYQGQVELTHLEDAF